MTIVAHAVVSDKGQRAEERRQAQGTAIRVAVMEAIRPHIEAIFNAALCAECAGFLGRSKGQRRAAVVAMESVVHCAECGRHRTVDFVRKGFYGRSLLSMWGELDLQVPRAECTCGHSPTLAFVTIRSSDRLWCDVDAQTLAYVAVDISLRAIGWLLQLPSGCLVSIGTVQRRVQRVAALARGALTEPLPVSPAVVLLDALWGTQMVETGETKRDKRGRLRKVKRGQKVPLLVALGLDAVSGETTVLAWTTGKAEGVEDWTRLLTLLYERGVTAETGLRLFIHDGCAALESALGMVDVGPVRRQRCIFHKLRNVLRAVMGEPGMSREAKTARVRAVLEEAQAIYAAPTEAAARERAAAFHAHWQTQERKAVETLERDFDQTLTYYAVAAEAAQRGQIWPVRHLRTTSALEGCNSSLRDKWRQAGAFWSQAGCEGALWLVIQFRQRSPGTNAAWLRSLVAADPHPYFPTP